MGAVARTISTETVQRTTLTEFLSRADVQRATVWIGVDPRTVESADAGLTGERLARAVRAVDAANSSVAAAKRGGDPKVTLSLTAQLLIILLVVSVAD